MKALQTMMSCKDFTAANVKAETLPTGESVSKAIIMGSKNCCGSASPV